MADSTPLRGCDACDSVDDTPRHIVASTTGDGDAMRHLACCAQAGCPLPPDHPANCAVRVQEA